MTLGCDSDSIILAGVSDAFLIRDSELIVIESIRQQITSIDLHSLHSNIIGNHGSGPNEYTTPVHGCVIENGSGLAVSDQGKVLMYNNNTLMNTIPGISMFAPLNIIYYSDSCVLARIISISPNYDEILANTSIVILGGEDNKKVIWSDSGQSIDLFSANDLLNLVFFGPCFTVDSLQNVYLSERNPNIYKISCIDTNNNIRTIVEFNNTLVLKNDLQMENEIMVMESFARASGTTGPTLNWIPEREFDQITDLDFGPDGNLWVRRGGSDYLTFDIINTNGDYIKSVILDSIQTTQFWITHINQYGVVAYDLHPDRADEVYVLKYNDVKATL